jgi:protoporphyrinogen IX oxidase
VTGGYVQMALLGALLTFAPVPLYDLHQTAPLAWGMTPLSDQQLAGLIMWVPGGLPYAVAGAIVARRGWMRQPQRVMRGFDLIPYLKALHIVGLLLWCGGLFALPGMLAWHDPAIGQADYRRIRRATHYTYTFVVTPAAVIAVIAGTWLILIREVYEPWLYLKLAFVALLVALHGWVGHIIVEVAETSGTHRPPSPTLPSILLFTASRSSPSSSASPSSRN